VDGPEIVEFDQETIGLEQRRAEDLAFVMKPDRRTHEVDGAAGRKFMIPGDLAVLESEIAHQRDQKA
jgi:hypothetical protein